MRVLVVEDDQALAMFLQRGLSFEGHDAQWVGDGEAAIEKSRSWKPDLVVLDLGLPRRNGHEVLQVFAAEPSRCSVLVLTGHGEVEERVRCLNMGADDFLVKPFSFQELMARCRALLRRHQRHADPVIRWGDLVMDRLERTVERCGRGVELTAREFALLESLMLHQGETCSRAELLEKVWQMAPDTATNVLDVYVNYLRRKLSAVVEAELPGGAVIETVRGSGYRMALRPPAVRSLGDTAQLPTAVGA
ncbi:MAG TPA: response regulator transcription factor [Candidatus Aquilonibacter sp.]|nr:response regulator transcription factor [Candidatus Aquilonibacter sp.]